MTNKTVYAEVRMHAFFIKENCEKLITTMKIFEGTHEPVAVKAYNVLEDISCYLKTASTKTSFGEITDSHLSKLSKPEAKKVTASLRKVAAKSLEKFEKHYDKHPCIEYYKAVRVFDPKQLPTLGHSLNDYSELPFLKTPSGATKAEWDIYTSMEHSYLPEVKDLGSYWSSMSSRFPNLSKSALEAIWMPVSSVDVERSFSQYKHVMNDRRQNLTAEHTRQLSMLYFNGDCEGRLCSFFNTDE
jgi:hypothetical protein